MYLQHFGLRHAPLGKELTEPWDDGTLAQLTQRFHWLLQSPGLGLLTGEPGVGKTAALRSITATLNPHRYLVLYQAETDFGRIDIYRGLALFSGAFFSGAFLAAATRFEAFFAVGSAARPPMLFDYYGFPEETYRLAFDAPGSPALAQRVRDQTLQPSGGPRSAV